MACRDDGGGWMGDCGRLARNLLKPAEMALLGRCAAMDLLLLAEAGSAGQCGADQVGVRAGDCGCCGCGRDVAVVVGVLVAMVVVVVVAVGIVAATERSGESVPAGGGAVRRRWHRARHSLAAPEKWLPHIPPQNR